MERGDEAFCQGCRRSTITVTDYRSGDVVCTECSLVVEAWLVDTTPEWRSFVHENLQGSSDQVPDRVGFPVNPLLDGCSPAPTLVSKPPGRRNDLPRPSSVTARDDDSRSRALLCISSAISDMSDALGLVPSVKIMAMDVYKKVHESKAFARKNRDTLPAACLFVACRLEHYPRTLNEFLLVTHGSTKKKLGRDVKFIEQLLSNLGEKKDKETAATAADFMTRFSSNLCLGSEFIKAAKEAVLNLEKLDIRRTPASSAAGLIYMMTQLSDKRPLQAISSAVQVSEVTILKTYKDLYPHASFLMPSSFATKEQLSNLPRP